MNLDKEVIKAKGGQTFQITVFKSVYIKISLQIFTSLQMINKSFINTLKISCNPLQRTFGLAGKYNY